MKFFYLKHHYLSIVRKPSYGGEVLAFFFITVLLGGWLLAAFSEMEDYVAQVSLMLGFEEPNEELFLGLYFLVDFFLRLVFRRPLPKLRYYALLSSNSKQIAWQYLITTLFGLMPYVFALTMVMIASLAYTWFEFAGLFAVLAWFLANHFVGLFIQFSSYSGKVIVALFVLLPLLGLPFISHDFLSGIESYLVVGLLLFLMALIGSYYQVSKVIRKRDLVAVEPKKSLFPAFPGFSFKNPIIQLEWALLSRNRRTRSNLLFGLLSVFLLPFIVDDSTNLILFIFYIATGFFIIQHGVYSLGWEGSYYDFLITNISPRQFIKTRYVFYIGSCTIGLLLVSIPTIIRGFDWVSLFCIFLYNIGVTIPLVLYRSTLHDAKIVLSENSFMNYNGMMTGPIFVTSFLIMMTPLFIYGVGQSLLGGNVLLLFALPGCVGLALFNPITELIAKKHYRKKYHLSQSFKS